MKGVSHCGAGGPGRLREVCDNWVDFASSGVERSMSAKAKPCARCSWRLYLLLVLLAYYILKPVSRAMFLNKFDIDELPYLYIVIAAAGGVMAYFYTKLAIHSSLKTAVNCLHVSA